MKLFNYEFSENELGTVLAALRYYQRFASGDLPNRPTWATEIATDCGELVPLNSEEIDLLCEKLNFEGESH